MFQSVSESKLFDQLSLPLVLYSEKRQTAAVVYSPTGHVDIFKVLVVLSGLNN